MHVEEFKNRLVKLNINLKEFAKIVNLSYSTVCKYGRSNPMPGWVEPFLDVYSENQELKDVKKTIIELSDRFKTK